MLKNDQIKFNFSDRELALIYIKQSKIVQNKLVTQAGTL